MSLADVMEKFKDMSLDDDGPRVKFANDVLEEAAKVCDDNPDHLEVRSAWGKTFADAIRALKREASDAGTEKE